MGADILRSEEASHPRSHRPELAVAGVAQAGDDVAPFVQVRIDGTEKRGHIGVGRPESLHPFRGGDHADENDPGYTGRFQDADGFVRAAAGGQHRIEHEGHV